MRTTIPSRYPAALLALYVALSVAALVGTSDRSVTGDEPHYLIMASGIAVHGSVDGTKPYQEESRSRHIYAPGIARGDEHLVAGPHGRYSIHNIGLPALLSVPYGLGGVLGSRLFMIGIGAGVVFMTWLLSGVFSSDARARILMSASVSVSLPLIPATTRIYPDVPAGLVCLCALYWLLTLDRRRGLWAELGAAAAIAFLPWLQIKFSAPALVLAAGAAFLMNRPRWQQARTAVAIVPLGASLAALGAFNAYAYGSVAGPYGQGALEVSRTSVMVLLGLHLDQNQGFLLQNPVLFVGVFAIGALFARSRPFAVIWLLTYASLIVPNSLHPNWYGGWSPSGRFQWAGAIVFAVPALLGLSALARRTPRAFRLAIGAGAALQAGCLYEYAFSGVNPFNRGPGIWRDFYSTFYGPISSWLPELYDARWAYRYGPNVAFLTLALGLLGLGFALERRAVTRREYLLAGSLAAVMVIAGAIVGVVS